MRVEQWYSRCARSSAMVVIKATDAKKGKCKCYRSARHTHCLLCEEYMYGNPMVHTTRLIVYGCPGD